MAKRNGKIELMRFVFCILIILYHIHNRIDVPVAEGWSFFKEGLIGVEFFFLVSGFLMAKSAKKQYDTPHLTSSTVTFMKKKLMGILPYHIVTFLIAMVAYYIVRPVANFEAGAKRFFLMMPNFFLIQKTGIPKHEILTAEWYLSAMLICMLVIYPILVRGKSFFTKIVCPLFSVLLIGYMSHIDGYLQGTSNWVYGGSLPKSLARAGAELCFGIFCYEACEKIKSLNLSKADRVWLTILEDACYILVVIYTFTNWSRGYEAHSFYLLAIAITLSFSNVTYGGKKLQNKFVFYLGKMSLPIYLAQGLAFIFMTYSLNWIPIGWQIFWAIASSIVFGIIIQWLGDYMLKAMNNKIQKWNK